MILGPDGSPISETLREEEGIVYADLDLEKCVAPKQFQDVVGYYNRFDVFVLTVNRRALSPVRFKDDGEEGRSITPRPAPIELSGEFGAGPSLCPDRLPRR